MKEKLKVDPELKKEWDRKLENEFGLREELDYPEEVPEEKADTLTVDHLLSPKVLSHFSSLPEKLRADILEDVKALHEAGESFDGICKRVKTLIVQGEKLDKMGPAHSDTKYRVVTREDEKVNDDEDEAIEDSHELIKRLEQLVRSDEQANKKETIH